METLAGTGRRGTAGGIKPAPSPEPFALSQNFFTLLFYLAVQTKAPAAKRGLNSQLDPL
jgi:hypothetical protein